MTVNINSRKLCPYPNTLGLSLLVIDLSLIKKALSIGGFSLKPPIG
ncbi:hypothetical protein FDUTEX481_09314 [Tolypothrix sp. PCC 7601]|nr:hypothetical protein FDUTEX481_09314 [Tolypothrix sp. PCC 7601]